MSDKVARDLPLLTQARFAAAAGVIWFHYGSGAISSAPAWLRNIASSGYAGVPFFFLLSGFILVHASRGRDLQSKTERLTFWWRRVARVYPVYLLAWILYGALVVSVDAVQSGMTPGYFAKTTALYGGLSLALLQTWIPGGAKWNVPGWSLSCEAFFYAGFPIWHTTVGRLRTKHLFSAIAWLLLFAALSTSAAEHLREDPLIADGELRASWGSFFAFLPIAQLPTFLIGVVSGHAYARGLRLPYARVVATATTLVIAATLMLPPHSAWGVVPRDVLLVPEFALLLYALATIGGLELGWFGRAASLLGRASFAVYILQRPLWEGYTFLLGVTSAESQPMWVFLSFCALLIASAIGVYQWFERPVERWIRQRFVAAESPPRVLARAA